MHAPQDLNAVRTKLRSTIARLNTQYFGSKPEFSSDQTHQALQGFISQVLASPPGHRHSATEVAFRHGLYNTDFPSEDELFELTDLVMQLARLVKRNAAGVEDFGPAVKWVGRNYSALGLKKFVEKLLYKLEQIPVPPRTRIWNRIREDAISEGSCSWKLLYDLLGNVEMPFGQAANWRSFYLSFKGIAPVEFQKLVLSVQNKRAHMQELDFGEIAYPIFGALLLQTLRVEHQNWLKQYDKQTSASVRWLQALGDQEIDSRLRRIFHGIAPAPEQAKQNLARFRARKRQQKHRMGA